MIMTAIDPSHAGEIELGAQEEVEAAQSEYSSRPASRQSSRPASRQSVRTYEEDLSEASHESGDVDDDVEYQETHSRSSSRHGRATPDVGALKLSDTAHAHNAFSRSSSRGSEYKSPDSFLSLHSVSTLHPQDAANEGVLMSQVASLPNLTQVAPLIQYWNTRLILSERTRLSISHNNLTIGHQIQHIAHALSKRTIEQRILMMSKPEGCIMIKFNVSNGNPVPPPPPPHSNAQTRLPHCLSPLLPPSLNPKPPALPPSQAPPSGRPQSPPLRRPRVDRMVQSRWIHRELEQPLVDQRYRGASFRPLPRH